MHVARGIGGGILENAFSEANDAVQGRLQLVSRVGQELVLQVSQRECEQN